MSVFRFAASFVLGFAFFLLPIPVGERFTVPFDVVVQWIVGDAPGLVGLYCVVLIAFGAKTSIATYRNVPILTSVRVLAVPLALLYFFRVGPEILLQPAVRDLMWSTLVFSVGVIVPIGAALLVLFVEYGVLDFIGTLMRPIMRPLFRLPGRSALDSLTSWVGSYSVGLYLTRKLMEDGFYTRREAYTIVTCFSTVSIGFVAVVAQTLRLLHLFPLIFLIYFVTVYWTTALFARWWPLSKIPDEYVGDAKPEPKPSGNLLAAAWRHARLRAEAGAPFAVTLRRGFVDGIVLTSTILGSILVVGTMALLIARETPVFDWLGRPLVPVLSTLGVPDAEIVAPAALVGIAEMYIPALLVRDASVQARFFIAVLSISQLIFFSAVAPMMIDMFRKIPIRARELVAIFLMRTAVLIPVLAGVTELLDRAGLLR